MPTEVIMPKVDMDMDTGTIVDWHASEGKKVQKGDALFDIETDKATMEIESPETGILQFIAAAKGTRVPIGGNVAWIFAEGEEIIAPPGIQKSSNSTPAKIADHESSAAKSIISHPGVATANGACRATPVAKRIAKSNNIDLAGIKGSGPRGRIIKADVERALNVQALQTSIMPPPFPLTDARKIADDLGIKYREIAVDRMRVTIADRVSQSKATVPHFYLNSDCRIDDLLSLRAQINRTIGDEISKKISINDLLVRACALALKAVPQANASWAGDRIIQYVSANISVAVAVEGGLMTPVVRDAQNKDVQTLAAEIYDLAARAKAGKLARKEYQGGSFSISNLGMYGVKSFNAVINPPEGMILAVGKANRQIVAGADDRPEAATIITVSLSCDHRVIDGAIGARWLGKFQNLVENPAALLLK